MTSPVYLEGEGLIAPDGSFYTEAQCRAVLDAAAKLWAWFQTLPEELRGDTIAAGVELERQRAMRRGS